MKKTIGLACGLCVVLVGCSDESGSERCEPSAGTICTVAGLIGEAGIDGDEGPANEALLYLPMDMKLGPDGQLYVVDWNNHRIRVVDDEGIITTFAGTGMLGDGPVGPALETSFNHPTDIIFDDSGDMVIAAWHNSRIKTLDMSTNTLSDACGTGARAYSGDEGPAETAILDLPASVELDREGNLFVLDQANQIIRRIDPAGVISRFAGACFVNEPLEDAPGVISMCPMSNKMGYDLDANPMDCMKPCTPAYGGDDGPALEARFALPFGQAADPAGRIAIDDEGVVYLADSKNHRIRRIEDGMVTTIAGTGEAGYSGDNGPATEAQLDTPIDIELGADGTLYVADMNNSCVRAIDPDGDIRTVIGTCGMRGFEGDGGPSADALLDRPYGIEVLADGTIYVSDTYNHAIRVATPE